MFWIKHRRSILWILYALFFLHAILWYTCGYQRIGQFAFGEIFLTLKTGIISAGTIFVLLVFIHALFFGGLFCGWFCHWGVTQDVFAWILKKCGIKPIMRHLESKYIQWAWFIILITQVVLFWWFNGLPTKFVFNPSYTEVWAGNPKAIFMICMTCIVSGFLLIFLFGERAFCRSICVFRLWFSWFEKFSKYKIIRNKECSSCSNECSNSCFMDVNVAEEVKINGVVRNTACVKCFKCMGACPNQALTASFQKSPYEKNEEISRPVPLFDSLISTIQVAFTILVLHFFGYSIGGNMSLSLGLVSGFVIIHILYSKSISWFEILLIPLIATGLHYGNDMNPATSLVKGLFAISLFIIIAKYIGFKKGFDFIDKIPNEIKVSKLLITIILIPAIYFSCIESVASYYLQKAAAAGEKKDWKTYADLYEKWGEYNNDKVNLYFDLGKVELFNLNEYDKALESFKKSFDLLYREDLVVDTAELLLTEGLPLHSKKLLTYYIDKGKDSQILKDLLEEAEKEITKKKAKVLGK